MSDGVEIPTAEPKRLGRSQRYQRTIGRLHAELEQVEDFAIDVLGFLDGKGVKLPPAIEQQRRELDFPLPGEAV